MYVCTYVHIVCMYVCMYGCMYVRMYVCTYVCMYVCTYVRMYVCMYVCDWGRLERLNQIAKYNDISHCILIQSGDKINWEWDEAPTGNYLHTCLFLPTAICLCNSIPHMWPSILYLTCGPVYYTSHVAQYTIHCCSLWIQITLWCCVPPEGLGKGAQGVLSIFVHSWGF